MVERSQERQATGCGKALILIPVHREATEGFGLALKTIFPLSRGCIVQK